MAERGNPTWKKGISGNPTGRTKGSASLVVDVRNKVLSMFMTYSKHNMMADINQLSPADRLKYYYMLAALVLPRETKSSEAAEVRRFIIEETATIEVEDPKIRGRLFGDLPKKISGNGQNIKDETDET